tara:strand:- start:144 stop:1067 length:924 start_codon:yes stop_codon:yes gene_type:complete
MPKNIYSIAKELYEIYYDIYKPPIQSLELTGIKYFNHISKYTFIYYYNDLEKVKIIASEREPVNIEMNKYFDIKKLFQKFGYSKSGYLSLFSKNDKKLPPLIGIHCLSPVYFNNNSKVEGDIRVHIINSIGIGLDCKEQPDYKYFISDNNLNELVNRLFLSYNIVWKCAHQFKLSRVIICKLGGGYFSNYFPGDYFEDLFIPALIYSLNANINILPKTIGIMGIDEYSSKIVEKIINEYSCNYEFVGKIPKILNDENTLYQNAWDPHSMVGNGNYGDNSLDGYFGRHTGIHFLCWPQTNPNIKYIKL